MTHTHLTALTHFAEAGDIRFAYRRFGNESGVPLLLLQHFRGGLDHWDPALTDGLAQGRPVILFNNAGVASSSGETPNTIEAMADHAAAFANALQLPQFDVLGFSIGGYVAQELVIRHAHRVRRLMLVGTGPRAGRPGTDARVPQVATAHDVPTLEDFLFLFFGPSAKSQAAGLAFWERRHWRTAGVDLPTSKQTMLAQVAAFTTWRQAVPGELHADLKAIRQPTLVVNGSDDVMIPTINSWTLAQTIPDAQLIVYPDSGHAAQFQYPTRFVAHATQFLDE